MNEPIGAFGKLPTIGDFFRLRLPNSFVEPWDNWLQTTLMSARKTAGSGWDTLYMSAPIWRFTLPANQVSDCAVSGVLMASVDRVGRQFPLTLACLHKCLNSTVHHFANTQTFEALETVALGALDDGATREGLADALDKLGFQCARLDQFISSDGAVWRSNVAPQNILAGQRIDEKIHQGGIWSTVLRNDHRIMVCNDLPNEKQALGLYDLDAPVWHEELMGAAR
jgi:type VI secretion system protein ImpM